MSKLSLKNIFLKEGLETKPFGKHGEKFPKSSDENNPLKHASEEDIDKAVDTLGEDSLTTKGFGKHGEKFPKSSDENNPLKHASEEDIDKAVDTLGEGEEFDAAFEKHQKGKEEKKVDVLDEPFSSNLEECGCGEVPAADSLASTDGLSANVLSQDRESELADDEPGPTEFVVVKVGPQDDGINFYVPDDL